MMNSESYDRAAFFEVVEAAQKSIEEASERYVSLYVTLPFYGGPEEGGWYGADDELVATTVCYSQAEAEALKLAVFEHAKKLSVEAKDRFNTEMARQLEWVEEHDPLCDDPNVYFPEPDGEDRYWVAIESRPGSLARRGERQYS